MDDPRSDKKKAKISANSLHTDAPLGGGELAIRRIRDGDRLRAGCLQGGVENVNARVTSLEDVICGQQGLPITARKVNGSGIAADEVTVSILGADGKRMRGTGCD